MERLCGTHRSSLLGQWPAHECGWEKRTRVCSSLGSLQIQPPEPQGVLEDKVWRRGKEVEWGQAPCPELLLSPRSELTEEPLGPRVVLQSLGSISGSQLAGLGLGLAATRPGTSVSLHGPSRRCFAPPSM